MTSARESPITDAVLWVNRQNMLLEPLGGMTILERQIFTLAAVGIKRVWVAAQKPDGTGRLRSPEGVEVFWVSRDSDGPVEARPPYLGVCGDYLIRREALLDILAKPHATPVSYQDESKTGVVQVLPFRGERVLQYAKEPLPAGSTMRLQTPADVGPATAWLLAGARKGHDGLMARFFDRYLSLAITRVLLHTPIRPNHMTVLSSLWGLFGALQFLKPGHSAAVAGAVLLWAHSVLDGCDGELARLKFQESRLGWFLDFWGDNLVHLALFACLGLGLSRAQGSPVPLLLGGLACVGVLGSATLSFAQTLRRRREEAPGATGPLGLSTDGGGATGALTRIETFLAQRDFIYLLLVVALLDKEEVFLWAGAVGAPLFFVVLFFLVRWGNAAETAAPPLGHMVATRGQTL